MEPENSICRGCGKPLINNITVLHYSIFERFVQPRHKNRRNKLKGPIYSNVSGPGKNLSHYSECACECVGVGVIV